MKNVLFQNKSDQLSFALSNTLWPIPHLHKEIELIYVINGSAEGFADRKSVSLTTGDLFIAFPNQVHYYENSAVGKYLVLIFNPNIIFELKNFFYDNIPNNNVVNIDNKVAILELLLKILQADGQYVRTVRAGLINQLMTCILSEISVKPRIKTDNSTIQSILGFCDSHFNEEITLDDVAQGLHISKYHISHLFNSKLGLGFNTYINILRINEACDLLCSTNKKISEISEDVGFGSIRSFNRVFLQIMDISPLGYRNKFVKKEKSKIL